MRKRFNILILVACTAILSIIVLQLYWLSDLYTESRIRLKKEIENTIVSAMLITSFSKLALQVNMDRAVLIDTLAKDLRKIMDINELKNSPVASITMDTISDPEALKRLSSTHQQFYFFDNEAQLGRPPDLLMVNDHNEFYKILNREFVARDLDIAFEYRIVNNNDSIMFSSAGSGIFEDEHDQIRVNNFLASTSKELLIFIPTNFNSILLKRIANTLIATILVIILCIGSFLYLVYQFYRQKKMSLIRSDFMNNMTHELKTPISSVSAALELMESPEDIDSYNEYHKAARKELSRLNLLVDEVLRISELEEGAINIDLEQVQISDWIDELKEGLRPILEKKSVRFDTSVISSAKYLYIDKSHFTNVIYSLIDNAIKYNDKLQPVIFIEVSENAISDIIKVSDNGKGIPKRYHSEIFTKFFRVPNGNLHEIKGHGLGLTYVRSIVSLHSGEISVKSDPGQNTMFIIKVPKSV